MDDAHQSGGLSLSELIRHVANELRDARKKGQNNDPVLDFSGCEIEMAVTFKVEGKAGLKIWVIDAGFSGDKSTLSKVKLNFGKPPGVTIQYSAKTQGDEIPNPTKKQKDERPSKRGTAE